MSSRRAHLRPRDIYTLKVRGWEKVFRANGVHKKAEVAILISHKIDFKTKTVIRTLHSVQGFSPKKNTT